MRVLSTIGARRALLLVTEVASWPPASREERRCLYDGKIEYASHYHKAVGGRSTALARVPAIANSSTQSSSISSTWSCTPRAVGDGVSSRRPSRFHHGQPDPRGGSARGRHWAAVRGRPQRLRGPGSG